MEMNNLSVKPFYIEYEDWMTDEQVQELLHNSVIKGARLCRTVRSLSNSVNCVFDPSCWVYFGVDKNGDTATYDDTYAFGEGAVLLTLDQVDAHLGLTKPTPVVGTVVQPKSLDNVKLDCRKPDGSVDEGLSRAFQEACFEQGITWALSGNTASHLDACFLFTNDLTLTFVFRDEDYFMSHSSQEIKFTYERKVVTIGGVEYYEDMIAPLLEAMQSARVSKEG